jgi:cytochrome c5
VRILSAGYTFIVDGTLAVIVSGVIWSAGLVNASPVQSSRPQDTSAAVAPSVLDGVFTSDQATRGEDTFRKICSVCHTLAQHTGAKFAERWNGSTVGDLFDLMSNTMPDGNPGSLKPEEYAAVIAFFLRENGYPEGKQELPADNAALMKVRIEPLAR